MYLFLLQSHLKINQRSNIFLQNTCLTGEILDYRVYYDPKAEVLVGTVHCSNKIKMISIYVESSQQ